MINAMRSPSRDTLARRLGHPSGRLVRGCVFNSCRATHSQSPFSHHLENIGCLVQPSVDELTAFGLALRTLRQRAQLSQEELAHICGLHRTYVGSVERGERNIGLLNIHVLARALNTTGAEMLQTAEKVRKQPKKRGR